MLAMASHYQKPKMKTPHVSNRVQSSIESFITTLRRRQIKSTVHVAERMLEILRLVVSTGRWGSVKILIDLIKRIGSRCQDAVPQELVIGNVTRRLLCSIRDECHQLSLDHTKDDNDHVVVAIATVAESQSTLKASVFSLFPDPDGGDADLDYVAIKSHATKSIFVEVINDLLDEIRSLHDSIAPQSLGHIHSNEIILTCGHSHTVEAFFKYAASKKRQFHVIVTETAPDLSGQRFASNLSGAGIETTIIPDAAVFAVMSRVNKVVLGTHAILANGGLLAKAGAGQLAAAAKHYSVPVVVTAGLYKLTTIHPYDQDCLTPMSAPSNVMAYANDDLSGQCEVYAPTLDVVSPDLISLFITNLGGFAPSYMYRLLTENYHPDDSILEPAVDRTQPQTSFGHED